MIALSRSQFRSLESVQEGGNEFFSLFPHRGDYIYAEHPQPGERPSWKTETRHLLGDRLINQGRYLYGVRFGSQTNYLMLDLDPTSQYHPQRDRFGITRLMAALEPIGLVSYVAVQSSYRGGIHLYFPFEKAQRSWAIALVVQTLLENAGFKTTAGQLEIFPNPKVFDEKSPTLYNGHRLPLQMGSYLLNEDWETVYSTQTTFVAQWKLAQRRNDLDEQTLEKVLQQAQRRRNRLSGKAQKFLVDLNADIEPGWTGEGQTNHLLGKIVCREMVFHHVLHGGEPLAGEALIEAITQVARSLPGFYEFCNHQDELEQRARDYVRSAGKRYYPYSFKLDSQTAKDHHVFELTWNQQQANAARERIRTAIADLLTQGTLPVQATDRFKVLKRYGIGSDTLYGNKDLWHPQEMKVLQDNEFPPVEVNSLAEEPLEVLQDNEFPPMNTNKFVGLAGSGASLKHPEASPTSDAGGGGGFSTGLEPVQSLLVSLKGVKFVQLVLNQVCLRRLEEKNSEVDILIPDESYFRSLDQGSQ